MKPLPSRTAQALGISASLLGAATPSAEAAASDTPPGLFFNDPEFTHAGSTLGATNTIGVLPPGVSTYTTVAGPDVFYWFIVDTPGKLTFTLTPTPGIGFDPAIYLLAGGNTAADALIGRDVATANQAESFTTPTLNPGIYHFVVDSFYSTPTTGGVNRHEGTYTLQVTGSDGIVLAQAIPEPGNLALATAGLAALGWRRRRQGAR
jgi:hypothetical protein